jgi:hypothetical protein
MAKKEQAVEKEERSFDPAAMDAAAKVAEKAFDKLDGKVQKELAKFWSTYYLTAGHKRLGRLMVKKAKDMGLVENKKKAA